MSHWELVNNSSYHSIVGSFIRVGQHFLVKRFFSNPECERAEVTLFKDATVSCCPSMTEDI